LRFVGKGVLAMAAADPAILLNGTALAVCTAALALGAVVVFFNSFPCDCESRGSADLSIGGGGGRMTATLSGRHATVGAAAAMGRIGADAVDLQGRVGVLFGAAGLDVLGTSAARVKAESATTPAVAVGFMCAVRMLMSPAV
jgi:hypothetical protein